MLGSYRFFQKNVSWCKFIEVEYCCLGVIIINDKGIARPMRSLFLKAKQLSVSAIIGFH